MEMDPLDTILFSNSANVTSDCVGVDCREMKATSKSALTTQNHVAPSIEPSLPDEDVGPILRVHNLNAGSLHLISYPWNDRHLMRIILSRYLTKSSWDLGEMKDSLHSRAAREEDEQE